MLSTLVLQLAMFAQIAPKVRTIPVLARNANYHGAPIDGGTALLTASGVGAYTVSKIIFPTSSTNAHLTFENPNGQAGEFYVDNVSIKEVTGIHATQSTTANKMILRRTNGRYWFDAVDGTDLLTTTYPAGYESVITIDAPSTGQVTLTAQNIVGTYNITTDTYGRFVFKTLTAGELAIMQSFANRLAGL